VTHSFANSTYIQGSTEADTGLSYMIERGKKRQARLKAAKDATAVTLSTVADNERTLTSQVASQYMTVELAESTLDLAQQDHLIERYTQVSPYHIMHEVTIEDPDVFTRPGK
jgi:outer membrane protein TolC